MGLQHTRSHSFPSASKPDMIQVDESLLSEAPPSSFSSVCIRIKGIENLYESIDDLLLLPHIQRIITQACEKRCVDEILEGYIILLDACAAAKDLVSIAKRDAQELLSGMRRRNRAEASCNYLKSRRNFMKMAHKALKASVVRKKQSCKASKKGHETRPVESLLMDAQSATLAMLNSLFSYMMRKKEHGTHRRIHSLVSKLMESKKVASDEETEFTKVDAALISFMRETKNGDDVKVDDLLNYPKNMESSVRILEDELECLFRRLIKTRVLLLNILSH